MGGFVFQVSITLETSETISRRFVHPSRKNSPTITKVWPFDFNCQSSDKCSRLVPRNYYIFPISIPICVSQSLNNNVMFLPLLVFEFKK